MVGGWARGPFFLWSVFGAVVCPGSGYADDLTGGSVAAEVRKQVADLEGITVRAAGDRVYLDGLVYTGQDAERVRQVVNLYPNVKSLVRVAPNAKRLVAENLTQALQRAGLGSVRATQVGAGLFLEGTVESPQELQKAEGIARATGEAVENLLVVGQRRMILSEVRFVEVRRQAKDRLGIRYPTDVTGTANGVINTSRGLLPGSSTGGTLGLSAQATSQFSLGFQGEAGQGRLLAQPTLVCASGEKAEFVAGGEVPVPLITQNQYSVEYKPYGVLLRLWPTADREGNIHTGIEAETSEVDTTVSVAVGGSAGIPGFRTRKVKTYVTVRDGETIVLSGVFSHGEEKAVSKVPVLGHIPLLGELFKSRALDDTWRELIIYVTPRIVSPESEANQKPIDDAARRYEKAAEDVSIGIFD